MCLFPYLAVVLRPEFRARGMREEDVLRVSRHHALIADPFSPPAKSFVARFADGASYVCTFKLPKGCACGWPDIEHRKLRAIAASLLDARDVMRVRFGVWHITGAVVDGDPDRAPVIRAIDLDELRDEPIGVRVIHLRRVNAKPHPRITLKDVLGPNAR